MEKNWMFLTDSHSLKHSQFVTLERKMSKDDEKRGLQEIDRRWSYKVQDMKLTKTNFYTSPISCFQCFRSDVIRQNTLNRSISKSNNMLYFICIPDCMVHLTSCYLHYLKDIKCTWPLGFCRKGKKVIILYVSFPHNIS